jgi:peptidoglycan/LPS O-acetylase OafA/YrhL
MEPYRPNCYKIPELNGLRVLLVFIVSWYHFWQQSWLTPSIGSYSLDYLLRAGYMPVDGTILLSGFLLFLPYARAMLLGEAVPNTKQFYQRRIMRIVPSYYFVTLALLFAVALPWHLYHNSSDMVRDVVMHLTFTQTFNPATYIATPIGVASWTIAIEMQAYLIFPLLARWAMKNPLGTLMTMAAGTFAFRGWCVWRLDEYNMVVNQLANFLDIYTLGMGAALLYVWLVQRYPAAEKRKAMAWQGIATLLCVLSTWGMLRIFAGRGERPGGFAGRADDAPPAAGAGRCGNPAHPAVCGAPAALFDGQPGDGLAGGGFDELLSAAPEPGRSPETAGRSTVRQRGTEPGRGAAVAAAIYPAVLWAVPAGGSAHYAVD